MGDNENFIDLLTNPAREAEFSQRVYRTVLIDNLQPEVNLLGDHGSVLVNAEECARMLRTSMKGLAKLLAAELGTPVHVDDDKVVLRGRYHSTQVKNALLR